VRVEVVRSARRRKTVEARKVGGVLRVSIPARMSKAEEDHWVAVMLRRFERWASADAVDVVARAEALARQLGLPRPSSVRWVDNQHSRWGSCTIDDRSVRLSTRLAGFPRWVIDYVIVHELAHLAVPDHSPDFWALVDRYPRAERAKGFLIAKGMEEGDEADQGDGNAEGDGDPDPEADDEQAGGQLFTTAG